MTEPKRLYRDVEKGMIGGVLAGLAEYLGADVTVVRVVYVLLWVFTAIFPGLIAYIVMWIIVPPKPTQAAAAPPATPSPPTPPPQW
ncbi:MAG: PspC domain-containing protein [Candidatus Thermoplasmatota archaeon]